MPGTPDLAQNAMTTIDWAVIIVYLLGGGAIII